MRIFNSLIEPKNVLGFFNVQSGAKHQTIGGGPFEEFKSFKKSLKAEKGAGKVSQRQKIGRGTLLGFAFQGRGLWMRSKSSQVLSTIGKSESFTKCGAYGMSEKSDEKKRKKTSHCNSRALFTRKAPTKKTIDKNKHLPKSSRNIVHNLLKFCRDNCQAVKTRPNWYDPTDPQPITYLEIAMFWCQ